MSSGKDNFYDIHSTIKKRLTATDVAQNYFVFRKIILRYIELMRETLLNGYDYEIPNFGTFSIVKRQNHKLHKYHILISRIGWEYLIVFKSKDDKMVFSACREFRVLLRDLLITTTKDFKDANC